MSTAPDRPTDDPLLRVLREHIEQQERALAGGPGPARVLAEARPPAAEPARPAARAPRRWAVGLGTGALAAVAAVLLFALLPAPEARAERAVREAEAALKLPVERCYLVEVQREGAPADEPISPRTVRVWTAGDRFRVEVSRGPLRFVWGRDADGSVWFTANPSRGARIAPEEQGAGLQQACDLYGLHTETVLGEMRAHCRLREDHRASSAEPRVIRAEPKLGARLVGFRTAVAELDPETSAIRKLALTRAGPAGTATTTFTLIDTRPVDEARYKLEGHLVEPYQVFDRDTDPTRRRELLGRWLGAQSDRWLSAPKK
jgi:hypothetical protein